MPGNNAILLGFVFRIAILFFFRGNISLCFEELLFSGAALVPRRDGKASYYSYRDEITVCESVACPDLFRSYVGGGNNFEVKRDAEAILAGGGNPIFFFAEAILLASPPIVLVVVVH